MKVFIDTSAFLALFIASDTHHVKVTKKYQVYRNQRAYFYTSSFVLDELYTRLIYDFDKSQASKTIKSLETVLASGEITLLDVDTQSFKKALTTMLKFAGHQISFTDATSFLLVKDLVLDEIFTLDNDFKKIGLDTSF